MLSGWDFAWTTTLALQVLLPQLRCLRRTGSESSSHRLPLLNVPAYRGVPVPFWSFTLQQSCVNSDPVVAATEPQSMTTAVDCCFHLGRF
jgi:hypothetical protein